MSEMPMPIGTELPYFTLRQIDLPDVREWEPGEQKYIIMKVEMVGKRVRKDLPSREDQNSVEGDFQMISIRPLGEEPIDAKTLESQDFERAVAKAKSGI